MYHKHISEGGGAENNTHKSQIPLIKFAHNDFCLTTKKLPTRRAVIWLGQTCNLNCFFCYFAERIADKNHPEHAFFTLEKAKTMCKIFVEEYGLNSIDIQGGEPTIYPHIFELISYCNQIGLKPTLITNGITLSNFEFAQKFKTAGIYDFLISLQGIGETYNKVVGSKNAFEKQQKALENLKKLQIPIRVNAVLTNQIIDEMEQIADLAIQYNARVVNFIAYNNTGDQKILRQAHKIPYYDIIAQKLEPIIDKLENLNIEVNLRFLPFCVVSEKYRKNIQNSDQMLYDNHEWEASSRLWVDRPAQRQAKSPIEPRRTIYYLSRFKISRIYRSSTLKEKLQWIKSLLLPFVPLRFKSYAPILSYQKPIFDKMKHYTPNAKNYDKTHQYSKVECFYFEQKEIMHNISKHKIYHSKCNQCDIKAICDGFYCDFIDEFGSNAIKPIKLKSPTTNPRFYSQHQYKVIEAKEWSWFFSQDELTQIKKHLK